VTDRESFSMRNALTSRATVVMMTALVVTVVGALGTWASGGGESVTGVDADGLVGMLLILLAAVAVLSAMVLLGRERVRMLTMLLCGALIAVVAVVTMADVDQYSGDLGGAADVSVGWGLWVALIGGVIVMLGSFLKD
jgi:hypothetical protein